MILRFRNLDLSIGRILKFKFLLKIKIRQQDGYKMVFLLEPKLTFEENDFEDFKDYFIDANQKLKKDVMAALKIGWNPIFHWICKTIC